MDKKEAKLLLDKYLRGNCTPEECSLLETWYSTYQNVQLSEISLSERDKRLMRIRKTLGTVKSTKSHHFLMPYVAAAALFAGVAIAVYLTFDHFPWQSAHQMAEARHIPPGGSKAVLSFADGRNVELSSNQEGIVIGTDELLYKDGTQVKGIGNTSSDEELVLISTPKGGEYQVILSDGTKVWLNAASSMKYPIRFKGKERRVKIVGEAYFEVAHMTSKPFRVESGGQLIEVMGTHFNVSAYKEEGIIKTTLLEGKVKVNALSEINTRTSGHETARILSPGQQSQYTTNGIKVLNGIDLEEITAWKNGYFKFGESLESIMIKVSQWYNVDVRYQDNFEGRLKFVGKISRSKDLSAILDIMESAGDVHFKVEGRSVTVMK